MVSPKEQRFLLKYRVLLREMKKAGISVQDLTCDARIAARDANQRIKMIALKRRVEKRRHNVN